MPHKRPGFSFHLSILCHLHPYLLGRMAGRGGRRRHRRGTTDRTGQTAAPTEAHRVGSETHCDATPILCRCNTYAEARPPTGSWPRPRWLVRAMSNQHSWEQRIFNGVILVLHNIFFTLPQKIHLCELLIIAWRWHHHFLFIRNFFFWGEDRVVRGFVE